MNDDEYEKALVEREKTLCDEQMKAFPVSEEEIKQLKKEGRIYYHQLIKAGGIFIPIFKKGRGKT